MGNGKGMGYMVDEIPTSKMFAKSWKLMSD
jgi:hypothetical protein